MYLGIWTQTSISSESDENSWCLDLQDNKKNKCNTGSTGVAITVRTTKSTEHTYKIV